MPHSQVTTFENYRKVQNTRSVSPTPMVVNVWEQKKVAQTKGQQNRGRPQTSMEQRSFGSMQTLGRMHNSSEHAPSNLSMQVE